MRQSPSSTADHELGGRSIPTASALPVHRVLAGIEVSLATLAVVLDLFIPALVIVALTVVSLLVRREGLASLGLVRTARPLRLAGQCLGLAAVWTMVNVALTKPVLEHVSAKRQDMSAFAELQGNVGMLVVLVLLSWTLAAFVEEVAFRGLLLTRLTELFGSGAFSAPLAVAVSSVLFGLLHTEYGLIGVAVSAIDATFYTLVRYRLGSLWAAICTHGFIDTIGLVAVFALGPVYGLW